ncbi:RHS repeat domain-containing protein [Bacillus wiedmannii]|uniref:RHS repeat domain-containing protein n=1 Tax=Bacillus wiedmannii TaxID=1890302 RepID=UPI003D1CF1E9
MCCKFEQSNRNNTWNENDQIFAITKQGENNAFTTYKYDENNRRIEKSVNGQVTRYFYDGDSINPLYEADGSENVLRQYVYSTSGTRLAMKSKGQTLYYHYNLRGDVVAMTDQNREVVATYEYDSWGNVLKSDTKGIAADNPFGYAGYMYDKEIGMYYLIARYYNPEHGVFLSVDSGDEDDPVTQNGYTYGDNNPAMNVDPDGHKAWKSKGKKIWYATKAGAKAVYDSYSSIGKAVSLSVGFSIGYSKGKFEYKKKNTPAYNKAYVNKAARKAGMKVGFKALGGVGLIEDAYTFGSAAYKGYKKAYKNNKKSRKRSR